MTERTVVLKFWDSITPELREIMVSKEMDPEIDRIEDTIHVAEQAKRQLEERVQAQNKQPEGEKPAPKQEWTQFKNRTDGNKNFKPGDREQKSQQPEGVRVNAVSPQNMPEQKGKNTPCNNNSNMKKLSRSKMDELTLGAEGVLPRG